MSFEAIEKILICPYSEYPQVENLLERVGIKVCSCEYDVSFDMYVLSESSMIIDKKRRLLIIQTCGRSKLLDVLKLIEERDSYYYYHGGFLFPSEQPLEYRSIESEMKYLFDLTQNEPNVEKHPCGAVEMWGEKNPRISFFYKTIRKTKDIVINEYLKGIGISYRDHVFVPSGYSINIRLDADHWMTVHVSPDEGVMTLFSNHEATFNRVYEKIVCGLNSKDER